MAQLLCFLLLGAIFGACTCVPNEGHKDLRVRRDFPAASIICPESFMLVTGPYGSSGKYVVSSELYNKYPVYTGPNGTTENKFYLRGPGASVLPGKWVLSGTGEVHDKWHGVIAYFDSLFSPSI